MTTVKIADSAVTYAKLGLSDGDIPGSKITSATISGLQISTGGVLTANLADGAITNAKIASTTIGAGKFAAGAIATADIADDAITNAKIGDNAVDTLQIANSGITAIKLANSSSTVVQANAPVSNGTFTGQQFLDTSTGYEYTWNGSSWQRQAAINNITFNDSTPIAFSVSYPDNFSAVITSSLDNQAANRFFAGPTTGANAAPTFRAMVGKTCPLRLAALLAQYGPAPAFKWAVPALFSIQIILLREPIGSLHH